jgi:dUTP pyrophosphatase
VEHLTDPEAQIQPHGIDLCLDVVWQFADAGALRRAERTLPTRIAVPFDAEGGLHLPPGAYLVRFREVVHLPLDLMALARPRSTLLRCGAALHTAVWDAGYVGRSEALLVVANPHGLDLEAGARICQMVFFTLEGPGGSYAGAYQGENL